MKTKRVSIWLMIVVVLMIGIINCWSQVKGQPETNINNQTQEYRLWTDNSGDYQIRARLVDFNNNNVFLEKDHNQISIPLSQLCTNDQAYVQMEIQKRKRKPGDSVSQTNIAKLEEKAKSGALTKDEIYTLLLNPAPAPYYKNYRGIQSYKGIWVQGKDAENVLKLFGNPDSTMFEDCRWKYAKKCIHPLTKKIDDLYISFIKIDANRNHTGKIVKKVVYFSTGIGGEKIGYEAQVYDTHYPKDTHLKMFCREHHIY